MKNILRIFLGGMAMGAADVVPGVSGGTIAFIIGIYPRLLNAIEAFNLRFFKLLLRFRLKEAFALIPWDFLLPLVAGVGISIFSLARAVIYVLDAWPVVIWSFFFGLILASILILSGELKRKSPGTWIAFAHGLGFGWAIGGAEAVSLGQSLPSFFLSGFIAICAMILPGISGSFMLVLMGQYKHVISAVATLDFPVLITFALGCLVGIMSFARAVNRLLDRFPNITMAFFTGLMAGGIRTVWPWHENKVPSLPPALDATVGIAALCCLAGIALPLTLHALPRIMRKEKSMA